LYCEYQVGLSTDAIAYPSGYPQDASDHQTALTDSDTVFEQLDELDEKFYAYEEDLSLLMNEFLR